MRVQNYIASASTMTTIVNFTNHLLFHSQKYAKKKLTTQKKKLVTFKGYYSKRRFFPTNFVGSFGITVYVKIIIMELVFAECISLNQQ